MPAIAWKPAMSVGVEVLDADHKILIDLINQLHEAMETDDAYETIRIIIGGLVDYTEYHFKREEEMMRACGYPDIKNHRAEHRAIEKKIGAMRASYDENIIAGFDQRLMGFMRDWLTGHILGRDMTYVPFMRRRKANAPKRAATAKRGAAANRAGARRAPTRRPSAKRNIRSRRSPRR